MGIFDALTTAVAGLQSQSFALQNISGNIANSQTVGYKETDTAFQDLVSQAALGEQTAGGVFASSVASNTVQGTIQSESVPTDMAIDGNGWFVVAQPASSTGQFENTNYYTRRGDFQLNQNGYLENGAGYYLMGTPLNPATGAAESSTPEVLQFSNNFLPASATTDIDYAANLPSEPSTGLLDPTDFSVNPLDAASGGTGTVVGNDASTFASQSLNGGSITAYDADGNPVNVQFAWAETSSSGGNNTWQLFYQANSSATGTQVAWQNTGASFTFNSSGQLTSPTSPTLTLSNLAVNGDTIGNVTLNFGTSGLTQFASSTGNVEVTNLTQNGFTAGEMQSLSVDNDQIVGSFSNGQTIPLADITLATFNGQDSLQPLSGEAYAATPESGDPIYSATGTIVGSSLEASNVDIATQFSQLIVAQQAYSANARVMTTANQMIQSLLTVIQ
jgi:flagellar hook protein FlgE